MILSLLPLFVLWFLMLTYGLTYLFVESELLDRQRQYFTSAITSPEDAAIAALLAEGTAERPVLQAEVQPLPPTGLPFLPPPTFVAKAVTSLPVVQKDAAESALVQKRETESTLVQKAEAGRLRRFVGRVLSCWMCSAGWLSNVSAGLVVLFAISLHYEVYWLAGVSAFIMTPPTGIGFVTILDHLSPKRAADRVVDAVTDIAQAALAALEKQPSPPQAPQSPKKV